MPPHISRPTPTRKTRDGPSGQRRHAKRTACRQQEEAEEAPQENENETFKNIENHIEKETDENVAEEVNQALDNPAETKVLKENAATNIPAEEAASEKAE